MHMTLLTVLVPSIVRNQRRRKRNGNEKTKAIRSKVCSLCNCTTFTILTIALRRTKASQSNASCTAYPPSKGTKIHSINLSD